MKRLATAMFALALLAGLASCGGTAEIEEPAAGAKAAQSDVDAAQRAAEADQAEHTRAVESARARLAELRSEVQDLQASAEPALDALDASARDALAELRDRVRSASSQADRLEAASRAEWKGLQANLDTMLNDLDQEVGQVAERIDGEKQVLRKRREEERKPVTGLFEGLDGGDYEAYRVSVVREVQRSLRREGYYPGPADGYLGRPTMEALARFQQDRGLHRSGVPTPQTRERLFERQG